MLSDFWQIWDPDMKFQDFGSDQAVDRAEKELKELQELRSKNPIDSAEAEVILHSKWIKDNKEIVMYGIGAIALIYLIS